MAKNNFDILARMSSENKDISVSINNFVGGRTVKAGAIVEIGVDNGTFQKLAQQAFGGKKYHTLLFVCDADQYDAIRKEVEAETKRESNPLVMNKSIHQVTGDGENKGKWFYAYTNKDGVNVHSKLYQTFDGCEADYDKHRERVLQAALRKMRAKNWEIDESLLSQ